MKRILSLTICTLLIFFQSNAQTISFTSSLLAGENLNKPTSLQFGPDGRLYVSQQNGLILAYTISRNGPNSYSVTNTESINIIQQIPNHNDNGQPNSSVNTRQVTGILVLGTPSSPILYVTSSDPRIGGNSSGTDTNLDTNSGMISRVTKSGNSWTRVDLVRGLPRSEENHSPNGMAYDPVNNYIYMAQGGNTNMGAPSNNFAKIAEYAYSTAILRIDLNAIGNTTYDLPTLDDESRTNVSGKPAGYVDPNDPFGGNNGKNQAMLVPNGPVQIYSTGWRNNYDVLIAKSGKMYSFDNGPNSGWGGPPSNCTNNIVEPGIAACDALHWVTPGYYAGHANPTRGNVNNKFNTSNPQSPVPTSMQNTIECTWIKSGDRPQAMTSICTSTNGMAEYTASNFSNAMKGNLLATGFNGNIYRFKLNAAGTALVSGGQTTLASGLGTNPLDIVAQGDNDIFPGTIWIATYGNSNIAILEPNDFFTCSGNLNSFSIDSDGDCYSNGDETLNETDPCNAASKPDDFDNDCLSDLYDPDDDNDGINDMTDKFPLDASNGMNTTVPVFFGFDNTPQGGLKGWGFTGLMTNGGIDYLNLFDPQNMTVGGAAHKFTIGAVPAGDAVNNVNTQLYGFQFGLNVTSTPNFFVQTRVMGPFAGFVPKNHQSFGMFIGTGDQDNYLKIVCAANGGAGGIEVLKEVSASSGGVIYSLPILGKSYVDLYLYINKSTLMAQPKYAIEGGPVTNLGPEVSIPANWVNSVVAVGFISTSINAGQTFPATWDFIKAEAVGATGTPVATITSPSNNSSFTAPANVPVSVTASSPNGSISKVDFYLNNTLVHTDNTLPFSYTLPNLSAGNYTIGAIATDAHNATGTATPVNIVVNPSSGTPQVTITSPSNNSSYIAPANVSIAVTASSTNSSISKVDFYLNNALVHTDNTSPFTHSLSNLGAGNYIIGAVATNASNVTGTATPVNISVSNPSSGATALFVVGNTILNPGDQAILNRLQSLGFSVTTVSGPASTTAQANGKSIVLISSTINSGDVNTKFTNVTVPVIVWESFVYDDMKLTGLSAGTHYGSTASQSAISIIGSGHPLAAGLSNGNVTVYNTSNAMVWGAPSNNAIKIATLTGNASQVVIFGYETGAAMVGMNAPARRVGFFCHDVGAFPMNAQGLQLLDAAILWAAESGSAPNDCNGVSGGTASIDDCGVCSGGNTGKIPNANKDACGVCFGNGTSCLPQDCNGVPGGSATIDDCGVCAGGNTGKTPNANKDACGVCYGNGTSCLPQDCNGVPGGSAAVDDCGVCAGGNTGKIPNSNKDACGVCFGNGSSCQQQDCNGVPGGSAALDDCNVCSGGNTGKTPNANKDVCGVCFGNGSTCETSALFVVGNTNLNPGDQAVLNRLQTLGFSVTTVSGPASTAAHANGKSIILISSTINSGDVNTKFTNVTIPVIVCESFVLDDMKMTGVSAGTHYGSIASQNALTIVNSDHPLAAGLSTGNVTVYNTNNPMVWGVPSNNAIKIATLVGKPTQFTIFGYETGAAMVGMNAPARRVGFFCHDVGAFPMTSQGLLLLDAAILWAARVGTLPNDCNGVAGGSAFVDDCGVCSGGNTGKIPNANKDVCGVCNGNGSSCANTDCNGVAGGSAFVDDCGVCSGGNTGKTPNANKDACGVCFGNGSSCAGACQPLQVVSFTLMHAGYAGEIGPLTNGMTIYKGSMGSFNVRADICPGSTVVKSVKFFLNGSTAITENVAPYAIAGDSPVDNYKSWNPAPGNYLMTATPYSGTNGSGTVGVSLSINITVSNSAAKAEIESAATESENDESALLLYPNPNTGKFMLEWMTDAQTDLNIRVFNQMGQVVYSDLKLQHLGELKEQITLDNHLPGIYFLQLTSGDLIINKKFIVSQ